MAAKSVALQDLQDRSAALKLPGASGLQEEDLDGPQVSPSLITLSVALAKAVASTSASAKLAAKQVESAVASASGFDSALQQLDKAVCGASRWPLNRGQTLERLIAQLQATRLLARLSKQSAASPQATTPAAPSEDEQASALLGSLVRLVDAPPQPSAEAQLEAVHKQVKSLVNSLPPGAFDALVPEYSLSVQQKRGVEHVFNAMQREYAVRRRLLIERAKVTLQSMLWSKEHLEARGTTQQAAAAAEKGQSRLRESPSVTLQDVYNARIGDILSVTGKATSGESGRLEATVKSIVIGKVPDRGGRPAEGREAAEAAKMPDWAPRAAGSTRGGRGGGGGGGRGSQSGRSGRGFQSEGGENGRGAPSWGTGARGGGRDRGRSQTGCAQAGVHVDVSNAYAGGTAYPASSSGGYGGPAFGHVAVHGSIPPALRADTYVGYHATDGNAMQFYYGPPRPVSASANLADNRARANPPSANPLSGARGRGGRGSERADGNAGSRGRGRVQGGWRRGRGRGNDG